MKRVEVVAAIIRKGDSLFATRRGYGEWKGFWEWPGGGSVPDYFYRFVRTMR